MQDHLFTGNLFDFPTSSLLPEGAKEVCLKDTFGFHTEVFPRQEYIRRENLPLHMEIIVPVEGAPYDPQKDYPLIVYVQGSGWQKQHLYQNLGDMVRIVGKGYAVALVEYRSSDIAPIPAQAEDVKTAIRFLRKNGAQYRLKTDKIALWGDSSGAHTALLAGITGNSGPDTPIYREYSAEVTCIVDWYGPVDMVEMCKDLSVQDHTDPNGNFGMAIGGYSAIAHPEAAEKANILHYLNPEKATPPILIMHGDRDHVVPFRQSCLLYHKLRKLRKEVEFVKVRGAFHAFGGFHCDEALDIVLGFIQKYL